jgi:hypothetical protein
MSEFNPITTAIELSALDADEMVEGYRAGLRNGSAPGSDKSKSYWHGWRNGMVDGGHAQIDCAQTILVREVVGTYRGLH